VKKYVVCAIALLVLSSCSRYSSNGEEMYLRSHNGVMLDVPPPLTRNNISNAYNLPPQTKFAEVSIEPPMEPITED
jgi:uncharacterized lipoprotein